MDEDKKIERLVGFEAMINNIIGGILLCAYTEAFPLLFINEGFIKMTGYTWSDVQERSNDFYAQMLLPEERAFVEAEIRRKIRETGHYALEYRLRRKDGEMIWVLDQGGLISAYHGQTFLQRTLTEITVQKEREADLRKQKRYYDIALSFSNSTLFDYDVKSQSIQHHSTDCQVYDMPAVLEHGREEVIQSGMIAEKSKMALRELYAKIDRGEPSARTLIYVIDLAGKERVFDIQMVTIFDQKGEPIRAIGVRKDITEDLLLQKEKQYGHILASDRLFTYEANVTQDRIIDYDEQWASEMGLHTLSTFSGLVDVICRMMIASEDAERVRCWLSRASILASFEHNQRLIRMEYRKRLVGCAYEWFEQTLNIIQEQITGDIIIRSYIMNIHDKKEKELHALKEQKHYKMMLAHSVIVYEVNMTQDILLTGHESWGNLFGIEQTDCYTEMMSRFYEKILHPADKEEFQAIFLRENVLSAYATGQNQISYEYRRLDEEQAFIWVRCMMNLFTDPQSGDIRGFCYVERIDEEKKKELMLLYKSQYDVLTGLYNKATIAEKINAFLDTCEARMEQHVFMILDLDYFKAINDHFGHAFGDEVLAQVAAKMRSSFRNEDILGRIGGDEFVVLMKNIRHAKMVMLKAQEIGRTMTETYIKNGVQQKISACIGIAFYPQHGQSYEELYHRSDLALYHVKQHGRDGFAVYREDMNFS